MACFGLICKMLSGECVEPLLRVCPAFKLEHNCDDAKVKSSLVRTQLGAPRARCSQHGSQIHEVTTHVTTLNIGIVNIEF